MVWKIISSVIALISLYINYLQYKKNKQLSLTVSNLKQKAGGNINNNKQNHSGKGDNINIGGDANINR
jgi:hypothetical protein